MEKQNQESGKPLFFSFQIVNMEFFLCIQGSYWPAQLKNLKNVALGCVAHAYRKQVPRVFVFSRKMNYTVSLPRKIRCFFLLLKFAVTLQT